MCSEPKGKSKMNEYTYESAVKRLQEIVKLLENVLAKSDKANADFGAKKAV